MDNDLKVHITKLQNRALRELIAILLCIISIGVGIPFLLVPSFVSVIFFIVAAGSVAYLFRSARLAMREEQEAVYEPVRFIAKKPILFSDLIGIFESLTDKESQLSISGDVRFFRFSKVFKLRTVIYKTADFNKTDYDHAKNRINKKANKELNISHWVNRAQAGNMMRFNVIYTDTLNAALYQIISQNAKRNLLRVEGIINIAIVGNQIIIPPIYGPCDLAEISRYKGVIKFIDRYILDRI